MSESIEGYDYWDELIGGKTVVMEPRPSVKHNIVASCIYAIFHNYLDGSKDVPFGRGTDLYLNENDRFIPDMMVVCNRGAILDDGVHGAPDLVVEVISPSTADRDRVYKKTAYGKAGVREYWIVDPEKRFIEVYVLKHGSLALNAEQSFSANTACDTPKDTFRCSIYNDLTIRLHDIFGRLW